MGKLGVCYYPEHWPETMWARDASRMVEAGIEIVRIGEFAWSRLEPEPGQYDFDWLARAVDTLAAEGLGVVLGTPTATPPKWLVDQMPDMLAVDSEGRVRGFGSRRHYCFSHKGYRKACSQIVMALAKRFGDHDAMIGWQTDNEYGCHDTTLSYSSAAREAFREWLAQKYQSPEALNRAWGNVFWSMEVRSFDEIELPNLTVTEANPAHWMDFRRFASDEVASFNRLQVDILRKHSPGRDIIHNFMGRTLDFDHFDVCADLDVASWDSYPLGFLEDRSDADEDWKRRFAKAGDPDFQAFHHDLYRATGRGRWWVMEQQPGPVNWAPHNPAPRDGMVSLWALEAFAHGAEAVAFFRWRQAPFAQEQMHAGLLRCDDQPAPGLAEAKAVRECLDAVGALPEAGKAPVVIVFDYASAWAWQIQPQGREFDYFRLVFDFYRALRRAGFDVDIQSANSAKLDGYQIVFIPGLFSWNEALIEEIRKTQAQVVIGPRSGSKTPDFQIPKALPPDLPADLLDAKVIRVESLRADCPVALDDKGRFTFWFEHIEMGADCSAVLQTADGAPALVRQDKLRYLAGWPDDTLLDQLVAQLCVEAKLGTESLPDGVRLRSRGDLTFAVNYGDEPFDLATIGRPLGRLVYGNVTLAPSSVAIFKKQ